MLVGSCLEPLLHLAEALELCTSDGCKTAYPKQQYSRLVNEFARKDERGQVSVSMIVPSPKSVRGWRRQGHCSWRMSSRHRLFKSYRALPDGASGTLANLRKGESSACDV